MFKFISVIHFLLWFQQIEELSAEREAKEDEIQRERALWTKHLNNMMAAKDETIRKQDETIRSKDEAIQAMRDEVKWVIMKRT